VFYGTVGLATRGDEGLVVWEQSPKRGIDGPEANLAQRFRCP
jgi:hypothetical protein